MRIVISLALAGAALPALAAPPSKEAAAFGTREAVLDISLSPDGKRVAIIAPDGGRGTRLLIATLGGEAAPRSILRSSGAPDQLQSCQWSTDTRLICSYYLIADGAFGLLPYTRLITIDADKGGVKMLTKDRSQRAVDIVQSGGSIIDWTGDRPGTALLTRDVAEETTIGSAQNRKRDGLGVESIDTETLARRFVEQPERGAVEYISDGEGLVRIMGLQDRSEAGMKDAISYSYRRAGQRQWEQLSKLRGDAGLYTGFEPFAVDRALNVAYGFDDAGGRRALYKVALDGSLRKELVLANQAVDVDGLIRLGRKRRVVGASYATERRMMEFFDPELRKLRDGLGRALKTKPQLGFVGADADEKKLLLFAGSDTDAGTYYLYDKATKQLGEVMAARPALAGLPLATMKPITFPAADGTSIPGYLTIPAGSDGKNLPAIVMPHGGPSSRDEWGFDWLAQFYAARGFAVLQPNYRGSAGYGSAWFQKNGFRSWRTAIGDVMDSGRWLVKQGIADPAKLAAVGWSYGGYAALQSGVSDPKLFKAIVAIAPVTDLYELKEQYRRFANFPIAERFIGSGPHVRDGSPLRNAARIEAPVLLFHGDQDLNVEVRQSRLMASALRDAGKSVEYVESKGLDHQLPDDKVRAEMLDKSDAFLRAALKM